jgi:hypothetical protein
MHNVIARSLASALLAWFVLTGVSQAQPPSQKQGPAKGFPQPASISVEDIIERIMVFDKNKDGKVSRDELPERMHHLIRLGDTNKDGALDKDEIRKLATRLAAEPDVIAIGGAVKFGTGPGPGPGGSRGFGGGAAVRFPPDPVEGVVDDLKLSGMKKEQALAAVKAHQANLHKLMDQARAELLAKMKEILSEEEFKDFRAALDRPRGATFFSVGPRLGPRRSGQEKLDQLPK